MSKLWRNIKQIHWRTLLSGIIIGIVTGLVISAFRFLIQELLMGIQSLSLISKQRPVWLILFIALSLFIGILISELVHHQPAIKGSGIPQTEAAILGQGRYSWWSVLWHKFIAGILTIGSGAFMGHEGPSIQIGGSIGQGVASYGHLSKRRSQFMVASGAAAGLAAVFNTPVASCLFIIETIYHHFTVEIVTVTLSAAIASDWVTSCFFSERPFLYLTNVPSLPLHLDFYLLILGAITGVMSYCYKMITLKSGFWMSKIIRWLPTGLKDCLPLLLVVPISILIPRLLGSGVNLIHLVLGRSLPVWLIIFYLLFKFILSSISFGNGLPGGILLPILTLGALIGAAYLDIIQMWIGISSIYRITFIVVAMAGFFASVIGAPFTSMILLTEMIGSLHHLVALAIVILIACTVDHLLNGQPIYHVLLERLLK